MWGAAGSLDSRVRPHAAATGGKVLESNRGPLSLNQAPTWAESADRARSKRQAGNQLLALAGKCRESLDHSNCFAGVRPCVRCWRGVGLAVC